MTSEHSSPRPVNPMTFRASTSDAVVQALAGGTQLQEGDRDARQPDRGEQPQVRQPAPGRAFRSPNGLCAVTAITAAAPASMIIGTCCA